MCLTWREVHFSIQSTSFHYFHLAITEAGVCLSAQTPLYVVLLVRVFSPVKFSKHVSTALSVFVATSHFQFFDLFMIYSSLVCTIGCYCNSFIASNGSDMCNY